MGLQRKIIEKPQVTQMDIIFKEDPIKEEAYPLLTVRINTAIKDQSIAQLKAIRVDAKGLRLVIEGEEKVKVKLAHHAHKTAIAAMTDRLQPLDSLLDKIDEGIANLTPITIEAAVVVAQKRVVTAKLVDPVAFFQYLTQNQLWHLAPPSNYEVVKFATEMGAPDVQVFIPGFEIGAE